MPLTYKAGRAFRRGDTSFVDAEPEKGILSVQDGGDGLLHIFWKSRNSPNYALDLIVFPGDASFSHVKESNEDNVFVLNFESSEEKHFFWFQAADAPYALQAEHINATIGNPDFVAPPPTAAATSLASTSTLPPATPAHQSVGSSSTLAPPAAPNPRRTAGFNLSSADPETGYSAEQLAQLQAILEGQVAAGPNAAAGESDIHLQDILTPKLLAPILTSSALRASLFPHLPSDLPLSSTASPAEPTEAELLAVIESPQFQEGVRSLDRALRSGLLGGLVQGLGLPEEAGLGVEQFLKAVGEQAEKKKRDEAGGGEMDTSE